MQYILNQEEFDEYQRLKQINVQEHSDGQKLSDFLMARDSMFLANWGRAAGHFPTEQMKPLYDLVTKMNQDSELFLLEEWRLKEPDFYEQKLAHGHKQIDAKSTLAQNLDQLATVNT